MKKVFCKKDYHFFDVYFEKDKYYIITDDKIDSCVIITDEGFRQMFYYNSYLGNDYPVPMFEMYFSTIKEIRKKKIKKIGINT